MIRSYSPSEKIDSTKVATLQLLLPWAIGRRSGERTDVVPITNAIVPGCLLPVCFPLCSQHIDDVTRYPTGASLHRVLSSAFVSHQFAIAAFGLDQLSAREVLEGFGPRVPPRPKLDIHQFDS